MSDQNVTDQKLSQYNVIAAFPEEDAARRAVKELHDKGIPSEEISYLGATAQERAEDLSKPEADPETVEGDPSTEGVAQPVTKGVVAGGATGGAIGGAAGFLTGLAAIGLPGVGPAVAGGVWAATAYGATAGATFGGVATGLTKMWEQHYQDTVKGGGALVGVHSDDQMRVHEAAMALEKDGPTRIDHLDPDGKVLND